MTQTLKLADDLFIGIDQGWKRCTVRQGKREIELAPLTFEGANNAAYVREVTVTKVSYTLVRYLTDLEAQKDGARSAAQLIQGLKRFYSDITPDSTLTIIEFIPLEQ